MNLYQYYEQKNTADKPAAVSRAYKVIDSICKEEGHVSAAGNFDRTELAEALVILHLVAESRRNDYLVLKKKYDSLTDIVNENDI